MPFSRISENEWTWQQGAKTCGVRYFPSTDRLIWSAWKESPEGPLFDPGYAQTRADFLANGVERDVPDDLLAALRTALSDQDDTTSGGWFGWLRRR